MTESGLADPDELREMLFDLVLACMTQRFSALVPLTGQNQLSFCPHGTVGMADETEVVASETHELVAANSARLRRERDREPQEDNVVALGKRCNCLRKRIRINPTNFADQTAELVGVAADEATHLGCSEVHAVVPTCINFILEFTEELAHLDTLSVLR